MMDILGQDLENKIKNEFPFKLEIVKDDTQLVAGTGKGSFKITVQWPFESGNDVLDTNWGYSAYEFHSTHPDEKSLEILIKLEAKQI